MHKTSNTCWLTVRDDDVVLDVIVSPSATRTRVMGLYGDRLKIQLAAPPAEGQANRALIQFLAKTLNISKAQVEIVAGAANKRKTICIASISKNHVLLELSPHSGR